MELKVWVEGIQRIVCGVTDKTTCQDVVYALAHATGKTGRFTLIERWRNNERLLAPHEYPLKILMKWGEYSNDVQFILQRSALDKSTQPPGPKPKPTDPLHGFTPPAGNVENFPKASQPAKDIKKSLTFSGGHHSDIPFKEARKDRKDNVGIVKGVPQKPREGVLLEVREEPSKYHANEQPAVDAIDIDQLQWSEKSAAYARSKLEQQHVSGSQNVRHTPSQGAPSVFSAATINSGDRTSPQKHNRYHEHGMPGVHQKREPMPPPYREPPRPTSPSQKTPPRELPPYRDPPPPTPNSSSPFSQYSPSSNYQHVRTPHSAQPSPAGSQDMSHVREITPRDSPKSGTPERMEGNNIGGKSPKTRRNLLKEFKSHPTGESEQHSRSPHQEAVLYNAQYRELLRLVNYQRERISSQQAELTKYDAEIGYWENKAREQQHQLEYIAQEAIHMDGANRHNEDQLRALSLVEEEHEIVKQQEKTLKSEITLLRSKLANCETELLQCKNKIRLLLEDMQAEQRARSHEMEEMELALLKEMERLQLDVEQARQGADLAAQVGEALEREVSALETAIGEKKQQVEHLVHEMKEANLQSLAIAPTEELRNLLEGPHKPGSTRKMVGSPRQLENAVPTSKNPHGVWV